MQAAPDTSGTILSQPNDAIAVYSWLEEMKDHARTAGQIGYTGKIMLIAHLTKDAMLEINSYIASEDCREIRELIEYHGWDMTNFPNYHFEKLLLAMVAPKSNAEFILLYNAGSKVVRISNLLKRVVGEEPEVASAKLEDIIRQQEHLQTILV